MKAKTYKIYKFLSFGFCFLVSEKNTGDVIYRADMYAVTDKKKCIFILVRL